MKTQIEIDLEAIATVLLAGACADLLADPSRLDRVAALAGVAPERVPSVRDALRRILVSTTN